MSRSAGRETVTVVEEEQLLPQTVLHTGRRGAPHKNLQRCATLAVIMEACLVGVVDENTQI